MKTIFNKKGYSFLEIIIAITIFSIFSTSIVAAFHTYSSVSKKNNLISFERMKIVSKLEQFLASEKYDKLKDRKTKLIIKSGFKELGKEIKIFERIEKSDKTNEAMKAFIRNNEASN